MNVAQQRDLPNLNTASVMETASEFNTFQGKLQTAPQTYRHNERTCFYSLFSFINMPADIFLLQVTAAHFS